MIIHVDNLITRFIKEIYLDDRKEGDCFYLDTKKKYVKKYFRDGDAIKYNNGEIQTFKQYYNKIRIKFDLIKGLDWLFYKLYLKLQETVKVIDI